MVATRGEGYRPIPPSRVRRARRCRTGHDRVRGEDARYGRPVDQLARQRHRDGVVTPPNSWETGVKDMVVALPGQVTRVRAQFTNPGQFVWHCDIVEHEDNEMMRPYRIGPEQPGQPK